MKYIVTENIADVKIGALLDKMMWRVFDGRCSQDMTLNEFCQFFIDETEKKR